MRFNVLGPIEVESETRRRRLNSPTQRTLLALLLINRHHHVSVDRITEAIWPEDDWRLGQKRVWFHISKLRDFLDVLEPGGSGAIVTGTSGYRLDVVDHGCDADDFERLVAQGTALVEADPGPALDTLESALALWRGNPFEDVPADAVGWSEQVRLKEVRLGAVEARFEAVLRTGRHRWIIPEIENAVHEHPFREGFRAQLMRALYRTERQADALAVYRETREILARELGIDPSPTLQQLEQEILQQAPHLLGTRPTAIGNRPKAPTLRETIVARDAALATLDRALASAVAGHCRCVFVSGEAGMGKTALLEDFALRARSTHHRLAIIGGRAPSRIGQMTPFSVVREALGHLIEGEAAGRLGLVPPPSSDTRRVAVEAVLTAGEGLVGTLIHGGRFLQAARDANLSESATRLLAQPRPPGPSLRPLAQQCVDTIQVLADNATTLFLVDDVHRIDSSSLDVLSMLAERNASILILGAFRPEDFDTPELARAVLDLARRGEMIDLDDQMNRSDRDLVDGLLDRDPNRFGEEFRQQVATRSGGNPLFALELIESLRTEGSVVATDGVWREVPDWTWGEPSARIEGVISHRFSRLDREVLSMLRVASVGGVEFSADLVAATLDVPTSVVIEKLSGQASGRHRLVEAVGPMQVGQNRVLRYRFRHELFQAHAYSLLDGVERPDLHAKVGAALEPLAEGAGEPWLSELARHFELAAMPSKAVACLHQSAGRAVRLGANVEAERIIHHALDLITELPPSNERIDTELDLQILLGLAVSANSGFSAAEVELAYRRATELTLLDGSDAARMPVYFGLWTYHTSRSQFDQANQMSAHIAELARASGDDGLHLQALHARWTGSLFQGDIDGAMIALGQARRIYRYEDHHPLSFRYGNHDPGVCILALSGLSHALRGEPSHAVRVLSDARALADTLGHPVSQAQVRALTTWIHQIAGDAAAALEAAERGLADLAHVRSPVFKGVVRAVLAWALSKEGRDAEALGAADDATNPEISGAPDDVFAPFIGCLATQVYLHAGLTDRAEASSARLETAVRAIGRHFCVPEVLHTRARVLAAVGRRTEAVSLAEEAVDRAEAQGAHAVAIVAATTLVSVAEDERGATERLRSLVGPPARRHDVPYVRDAMALLDA